MTLRMSLSIKPGNWYKKLRQRRSFFRSTTASVGLVVRGESSKRTIGGGGDVVKVIKNEELKEL